MIRRLSLRARLILGVIALATVGLVVADVATYGRSAASSSPAPTTRSTPRTPPSGDGAGTGRGPRRTAGRRGRTATTRPARSRGIPTSAADRRGAGHLLELRDADGTVVEKGGGSAQFSGEEQAPPPRLPVGRARDLAGGGNALPDRAGDEGRRPLPRARLGRSRHREPARRRQLAERRRQHAQPARPDRRARHRRGPRRGSSCWVSGSSASGCGRSTDRRHRGHHRRGRPLAPRSARRGRHHRGRPARQGAQRDARRRSSPPSRRARPPSGSCAASSPTPRTSCARRSRPCAPTPSSSRAARRTGPTISSALWPASRASPSG